MPVVAKKSLGQHFLNNPQICERIVKLLNSVPDDIILEIGPGMLALTRFLARIPHSALILLEKDINLARAARKFLNDQKDYSQNGLNLPAAYVILTDALNFVWENLNNNFKLIGNLPYNIASPLIWDIAKNSACWAKAVFMTQKEVGERIIAQPGTKSYGALSVWVQSFTRAKKAFLVCPRSFTPPPKVDSMVLEFMPTDNPDLPNKPENPEALKNLLSVCFQNRRKQLGTIFRKNNLHNMENALEQMNIPASLRPENLAPAQFRELARFW